MAIKEPELYVIQRTILEVKGNIQTGIYDSSYRHTDHLHMPQHKTRG